MEKQPIIIAIDGFSSSGKSTMARRLASAIGYRYIDSGAMYRAVALFCIRSRDDRPGRHSRYRSNRGCPTPYQNRFRATGRRHTAYNTNGVDVESEIRRLRVSNAVSPVAAIPAVPAMLCCNAKGNGQNQRHSNGRSRYRNRCIPRGRTQNIRRCFGRNPSTASIQRNDRKSALP